MTDRKEQNLIALLEVAGQRLGECEDKYYRVTRQQEKALKDWDDAREEWFQIKKQIQEAGIELPKKEGPKIEILQDLGLKVNDEGQVVTMT